MANWPERYRNVIVIVLAAVLAGAVAYIIVNQRGGPQPLEVSFGEGTLEPGGPIEVYIAGAVAHPGVYEMQDGDRVVDLLYVAGGFAPDADPESIALAERLHDEATVIVPRLDVPTAEVAGVITGAVDINSATEEDLIALPGIGEVYSRRIIESRNADGRFASPDELLQRDLIPLSTYERIMDLIIAGP